MKTIKVIVTSLLFSTFLFVSCFRDDDTRTQEDEMKEISNYLVSNNITTIPTWTGLYYIETLAGEGDRPDYYDTVVINYRSTLIDGTLIGSSETTGKPFAFNLWDGRILPGLNETISYMRKGGKANAIIPSALALGSSSSVDIKPYSTILYEIELLDIKPGIEIEAFPTEGLELKTTNSGLQYYKVVENDTIQVKPGDEVTINYTGYLGTGRIFYSTLATGSPESFYAGIDRLIKGFDEGLLLMKVGEKFRLLIPSNLAYGSTGSFPIIPSNEALVFDVELVGVN